MNRIKDKKAFTLIELIVIIAVLGILVLIGVPRFMGHIEKAELTKIQHDVKVAENKMAEVLSDDNDFVSWADSEKDLDELLPNNQLYEKQGIAKNVELIQPVNDEEQSGYKIIPENIIKKTGTKLKGPFYSNKLGKVYYENPIKNGSVEEGDTEVQKGIYSEEEIAELLTSGYTEVKTAEDLNNVRNNLSRRYIQTKDIDLSEYSDNEGWEPLGNSDGEFRGVYDGGGFKVVNLTINRPSGDAQGLFGLVLYPTIRNTGVDNVSIIGRDRVGGLVGSNENRGTITDSYATGTVSGNSQVGGLMGYNYYGAIENSYSTGVVTVTGGSRAGGLVGYNIGAPITNSYATGAVTGRGQTGGLVGYNYNSPIKNSYAIGDVTGEGQLGGLVGYNTGSKITNTYATGDVSGGFYIGGLVGSNEYDSIINSYSTGAVTGKGGLGGLVGEITSSSETSSYYDKETSGQDVSTLGTEKTTLEMKTKSTYMGWDEMIWEIKEGFYPTFK